MINESLLEKHGSAMAEDTIVALKIVMDVLNRVGGLLHFPISKDLQISIKRASGRHHAVLEAIKAPKEK